MWMQTANDEELIEAVGEAAEEGEEGKPEDGEAKDGIHDKAARKRATDYSAAPFCFSLEA
jgi:hypothetical protein